MLLSIQFPLADSRPFLPMRKAMLPIPQWPVGTPDKDFVRCFGMIRRRRLGGLAGWVGENTVCEAGRALRLPNFRRTIRKEANQLLPEPIRQQLGFRRFLDRKSTRLNSSHVRISYAVFCLKKKKTQQQYCLLLKRVPYH